MTENSPHAKNYAPHDKKATKDDRNSANRAAQSAMSPESLDEMIQRTATDWVDEADFITEPGGHGVNLSTEAWERLQNELADAKDRALRALAELENFRQRKNRELADDRKYADIELARDILPVWDNMGRAIEAAEKNLDGETLIEGVKMMYQQFLDILHKHHIERIEAVGKPFDPHVHESIALLPSDAPAGEVIIESQAGFTLHDRVVRPVQVVVAAPKSATS